MRPLCTPPFPLDRIEEMTALMGGEALSVMRGVGTTLTPALTQTQFSVCTSLLSQSAYTE